ncbi:MAG: uroporphyrinogen decarboxylase, partial [Polaromonas sp.]|nr:uroporphyrinogen decarboxylase [Polaromonas sp.]
GGCQWLESMKQLDCDVLGLDWTVNLAKARALVGENGPNAKALQGNLDPNVLFANPAQIEAQVATVLDSFGAPHLDPAQTGPTQIFNLGHGISQFTPPESVETLVRAVHAHSRRMRAVKA